jgi:hypothetical protein
MGQDKDNKLVDKWQIIITQIKVVGKHERILWQPTKQYEEKTFEFSTQHALILVRTILKTRRTL